MDDRTKIRQFIEGLLQFQQGEAQRDVETKGNPINNKKFISGLKVELPKLTPSDVEPPSGTGETSIPSQKEGWQHD